MKRLKLNRRAFTTLEGILLLAALLIIVGTAIYVAQATNKSNKNLNVSTKTAQNAKSAPKASELDIKEWGVKIGLSQASAGAHYREDDIVKKNPPEIIDILLPKAEAIKGPTGISCKGERVGNILRMPKADPRWQDPLWSGGSVAKKTIGDYSYSLSTVNQIVRKCFGSTGPDGAYKDTSAVNKFQTYINAFKQDFNSLQAS